MAIEKDIFIEQGESYEAEFVYCDAVEQPINLTGYAVKAQIRATPNGEVIADFNCAISPLTGVISIVLGASVTSALRLKTNSFDKPEKYHYDVKLTSPTDKVQKILKGCVYISPEVTK